MNFKFWLENVYRIDQNKIKDFNSDLKTYYHKPDWSSSGTFDDITKVPEDFIKSKGLFANKLKDVVPYVVPREVPFIIINNTIIFDEKDKDKLYKIKPFLSKFNKSSFRELPSGEFFSELPDDPEKIEMIRNPMKFLKHFYNVKFTKNIFKFYNKIKKSNINFSSEGL